MLPGSMRTPVRIFALGLICTAITAQRQPILQYINHTWADLTRSNRTIAAAAADPKFSPGPEGRWPVYVSANEDVGKIGAALHTGTPAAELAQITLRRLPAPAGSQGLLYLPYPYIVPGGRFNEMYGWDSYFIQLGLLRDGKLSLAKDMAADFLYEVRNYGAILNANRTYYLSRSQPPFLTEMVLAVYRRTHDRQWLTDAAGLIAKYYDYWTRGPHLTVTGLSRYWDSGEGPAPEVPSSERDREGRTHYDLVREYYRTHQVTDYDLSQYYDAARDELTPLFYKGDRSMRESGFDPSSRFGPFSTDIIHYNPVCLNSLLYRMEIDSAEIARIAGHADEATIWRQRADKRAALINRYLWDESAGLYLDYDFSRGRRRNYPFLTTFYPLWAGIASPEQASRVERNLARFEEAGGLETSTNRSGDQWDAPFGWAPLELIAVEGLRQYGYANDANRIAEKFLLMVNDQYRKSGIIVEKYNVVTRGTEVSEDLKFGYRSNEPGSAGPMESL